MRILYSVTYFTKKAHSLEIKIVYTWNNFMTIGFCDREYKF